MKKIEYKDLNFSNEIIQNINKQPFKKMLKFYQEYEKEAVKLLSNIFKDEDYEIGYNGEFDIKFNNTGIKYEVKTDNRMNQTGNVFIEYECYNKLSGINTTRSHLYIITDRINYNMIPLKILKSLCNEKYVKTRYVKDEKGITRKGYLIKKYKILNNSYELKDIIKFLDGNEYNPLIMLFFYNNKNVIENNENYNKNIIFDLINDDEI